MQRLIWLICFTVWPVCAMAQIPTPDQRAAASARLPAMSGAPALLDQCPADIFGTKQTIWNRLFGTTAFETRSACRADFDACLDACTDRADAEACLHVAVLLEQSGDTEVRLAARHAHAVACAGGEQSGCTNRGANIRNVTVEGDRLSTLPFDEVKTCLFDTFTLTCKEGGDWGCAMLGQAYQNGEGTAADPARAAAHYAQTCAMVSGPEAASCAFATRRLNSMGNN